MTIEYSYNELLAYKPTLMEKVQDLYWANRAKADATLFGGVIAFVATILVVMA